MCDGPHHIALAAVKDMRRRGIRQAGEPLPDLEVDVLLTIAPEPGRLVVVAKSGTNPEYRMGTAFPA